MSVNCFTEWDQLESIIVGIPDYNCQPADEPGVKVKIYSPDKMDEYKHGLRPTEAYVNAQRELDGLIRILHQYNVTVQRPDVVNWNVPVETPFWKAPTQHGTSCPRDIITVIGNEIIETGMSWRSRFFEYGAYRNIIKKALKEDPKAKWTAAPKPILSDAAYRLDYPWKEESTERMELIAKKEFVTTDEDIIFEAADIMRYGKDIFVQHGFTTNLTAIDWLRRHLGDEYRVHAITFPGDLCPVHQDATLVPIKAPDNERKGIIFNCPERAIAPEHIPLFSPSFDIVEAPQAEWAGSTPRSMCSRWLSMNMLHINPTTIVVEATEKTTIKRLESLGMTVIPCAFRSCYEMGGSFHCHTSDLNRRGTKVNYFPHLDKKE